MSEAKIFWYDRSELNDPIAIVGFPSIGLVGSIVTSFLARELKLKVVGGITLTDIQQYAFIQNGEPYPPVRIYAGSVPKPKRKKKAVPAEGEATDAPAEEVKPAPKKKVKARDVIVVTSEVAPKPEQVYDFSMDLFGAIKELGAREIIFVDGIPRMESEASLLGAYSTENARKMLEEIGITIMNDGIVRGISGFALYQGKVDNTDVMCIISPAHPQLPDPRSAADALEPLMKLIPKLEVDPTPLFKEAEEIESRVRAQQNQQSTVNQNLYG